MRYEIHWSKEFFRKICIVANFSYRTKRILPRKLNCTAVKSALIETALYFKIKRKPFRHDAPCKSKKNENRTECPANVGIDMPSTSKIDETKTNRVEITCDLCEKVFKSVDILEEHLKNIHEMDVKVNIRAPKNKNIKSLRNIRPEKRKIYSKNVEIVMPSDIKSEGTKVKKRKITAEKSENGNFDCPLCNKMFGGFSYLKKHIESKHKKLKKYQCEKCGEEIAPRKLKEHIQEYHKTTVELDVITRYIDSEF